MLCDGVQSSHSCYVVTHQVKAYHQGTLLIYEQLHQLRSLMSRGAEAEESGKMFLRLTNNILHNVIGELGQRGSQTLSRAQEGAREKRDPLILFQTCLALLNEMLHDYETFIGLHRDLLLGSK